MGFRIPLPVVNKAHQANQLYPSAISLLESVRTYDSINERIADKRGVALLVAASKREIQSQISEVHFLVLIRILYLFLSGQHTNVGIVQNRSICEKV